MNKIAERTNKSLNISRRRLLENLGSCGLSIPFLRATPLAAAFMASRYAHAADDQKKFILVYQPNGKPRDLYQGGFSSTALKPLDPHKNNVAALEMTISDPGNHGNLWLAAGALSYNGGDTNSSSVNAQAAKILGATTPIPSIQLGVFSGDAGATEPGGGGQQPAGIDRLNGAPMPREWNSIRAVNSIFSDTPPPPTPGGGGTTERTIFERRLAAYDLSMQSLDFLASKLGQDEKLKLDQHRASVETQQRVAQQKQEEYLASLSGGGSSEASSGGGSCGAPSVGPVGISALTEYRAQIDVAVTALKCGITNVASIQFSETQASWRPNDGTADAVRSLNMGQDHHNGANHGNPASLPDVFAYMNKGVAYLINQLKKEGLFENTVVCVISEMGQGIDHTADNGPITVASGIAGFRGNSVRRIDAGVKHSQIYSDVFRLLGLESAMGGDKIANYGRGGLVV